MTEFLAALIGLALFENVVESKSVSGRVGKLLSWPAKVIAWLVDPSVPGIPSRAGSSTTATASLSLATTKVPATKTQQTKPESKAPRTPGSPPVFA